MADFFGLIFVLALIGVFLSLFKSEILSKFISIPPKKGAISFGLLAVLFLVLAKVAAMPTTPTAIQGVQEEKLPTATATLAPTNTPIPTEDPTTTLEPTKEPTSTPTPTKYIPPTATPTDEPLIFNPPSNNGGYTCNCSKTCTEIMSCDEAYFQLNNCGCSVRDGDDDGVPCENLCE